MYLRVFIMCGELHGPSMSTSSAILCSTAQKTAVENSSWKQGQGMLITDQSRLKWIQIRKGPVKPDY